MSKRIDKQRSILIFFGSFALLLLAKAAELQIFDASYKERAARTTIFKEQIYPSRGLIYDRDADLLVYNNPLYDINVIYNQVEKIDTNKFCNLLDISKEDFIRYINKDWKNPQYSKVVPFTFLSKIKPENFVSFQEHLDEFPGFYPVVRNIRGYPHSNAAHILGYLGEVNKKVVKESDGNYIPGDYIGVSGIEKAYESELRGEKGVKYKLKDNLGRKVESFNEGNLDSAAVRGRDLVCSIDLDLQSYGEELLIGKRGSVVAIEPSSGEILTMISSPTFDPNIFNLDRDRLKSIQGLLADSLNRPSIDRSIMSKYPPGSIFKTVFALIAMQEGISDPNRTIYCDGSYEVNTKGFSQGCHAHPTPYNVSIALEHSCNSYFYQLMREHLEKYGYTKPGEGLDEIAAHLDDFGIGRKLGVDLNYENAGFFPDSRYFDKLYKKEINGWRSTYVLSLGIGQGETQMTTLQMANLAAIIANRGYYYTPHLVKNYVEENVEISSEFKKQNKVRIERKYFEPVIEGMERVIKSGTAQNAYVRGLDICGKTGTSQNPHGKDHSVFFAFAPRENPKIAIAVYIENAGFGAEYASPIGSLMIEKYLNSEIALYRKQLEQYMINKQTIEKL